MRTGEGEHNYAMCAWCKRYIYPETASVTEDGTGDKYHLGCWSSIKEGVKRDRRS